MSPWMKRLAIALSISLAVNLLLAGFLIGRGLHQRPERGFGPRPGASILRGREHGPWRGLLDRHRDELRGRQMALRAARRAAHDALVAPALDAARLDQALSALRQETTRSQEVLHRALVDAAAHADAPERRELARFLER